MIKASNNGHTLHDILEAIGWFSALCQKMSRHNHDYTRIQNVVLHRYVHSHATDVGISLCAMADFLFVWIILRKGRYVIGSLQLVVSKLL
jgi:hypothetical protein